MDALQSFTWVEPWTTSELSLDISQCYRDVYRTLKDSKSLVRLKIDKVVQNLNEPFGPAQAEEYPLWHISDLQTLALRQSWWPKGLKALLSRSPNLQVIHLFEL